MSLTRNDPNYFPPKPEPPPNQWDREGFPYLFDNLTGDPKADLATARRLGKVPGPWRERVELAVIFALVGLFVWLVNGCAFHVGRTGIDGVLAGTFYSHSDDQTNTAADCTTDCTPGVSRWHTHAARTWGTSGIEGKITESEELISIQGSGISDNLSAVLGEDVIAKAVEAYIRSTPSGAALAAGKALFADDEETPTAGSVPLEVFPVDVPVRPLERLELEPTP